MPKSGLKLPCPSAWRYASCATRRPRRAREYGERGARRAPEDIVDHAKQPAFAQAARHPGLSGDEVLDTHRLRAGAPEGGVVDRRESLVAARDGDGTVESPAMVAESHGPGSGPRAKEGVEDRLETALALDRASASAINARHAARGKQFMEMCKPWAFARHDGQPRSGCLNEDHSHALVGRRVKQHMSILHKPRTPPPRNGAGHADAGENIAEAVTRGRRNFPDIREVDVVSAGEQPAHHAEA